MTFDKDQESSAWSICLVLFTLQIFAELVLVWSVLPTFRALLVNPGQQPPGAPYNFATIGILFIMQCAYWYRLLYVALPHRGGHMVLSHILLFLGRLNFIFGGAVFSVVFFRHLPVLDSDVNLFVLASRGVFMVIALFGMFCVTLEFERLGGALSGTQSN